MSGPEHLEILGPLGVDQGTFVARDTSTGAAELVVVERVTRASPVPAARTELLRRGRALKGLEHPKVVQVHDVLERDGEVLAVSDYVDGEWLSSLMMMSPRPPLGVMLRVVIDILEGLGALHSLRDERDQPMGFVHGALGPDTVLVASDGVAEIARACRLPRPGTNERYVAPELRRGDGPAEVRCDIYAAGAILRDVLADAPADLSWAEPLTDIAWRACSVDVENRWPSALAMATTVRRVAGSRLASAATVAELMRKSFGEKIHARRAALQVLGGPEAPPPSSQPVSLNASDMQLIESSSVPTLVETLPLPAVELLPRPQPAPTPVARVALVKRPALILAEDGPETPRPPPVVLPPVQPVQAKAPPTPPPPPTAPTQPSLPPPTIVPTAEVQPSLPPPTIVPDEEHPAVVDAYRRQMPTFPIYEPEPPRRRVATRGMIIAGAIGVTFVLGWWLGRKYAPPAETTHASSLEPPAQVAPVLGPPATATATAPVPPVTAASGSATPPPSASAPAPALPIPSAVPAPTPTVPAWAIAPRPAPTQTVAPRPTPTASAVPTPTAKPTATHGNYNPEEL